MRDQQAEEDQGACRRVARDELIGGEAVVRFTVPFCARAACLQLQTISVAVVRR
jgi:hypothetical protein